MTKNILYSRHINEYLDELRQLTNHCVKDTDLLSLKETENIKDLATLLYDKNISNTEIPFKEKKEKLFQDYIRMLFEVNSSPIYIWTPRTNICGTYEINSILEFNFEFNFNVNSEGIIVILAKNFEDQMTLDFSIDENNNELLEIEVVGDNWCKKPMLINEK